MRSIAPSAYPFDRHLRRPLGRPGARRDQRLVHLCREFTRLRLKETALFARFYDCLVDDPIWAHPETGWDATFAKTRPMRRLMEATFARIVRTPATSPMGRSAKAEALREALRGNYEGVKVPAASWGRILAFSLAKEMTKPQ